MFLDVVFLDFLTEVALFDYVFVAFAFFGISLAVQYLIMRKRL